MDQELDRLLARVDAAGNAWREHAREAFDVYYDRRVAKPLKAASWTGSYGDWQKREQALKAAYDAAHDAWLAYLPRR